MIRDKIRDDIANQITQPVNLIQPDDFYLDFYVPFPGRYQIFHDFFDLAVIPCVPSVETKFNGFILMTVVLDSWLSGTKQIASSLELVESPHC